MNWTHILEEQKNKYGHAQPMLRNYLTPLEKNNRKLLPDGKSLLADRPGPLKENVGLMGPSPQKVLEKQGGMSKELAETVLDNHLKPKPLGIYLEPLFPLERKTESEKPVDRSAELDLPELEETEEPLPPLEESSDELPEMEEPEESKDDLGTFDPKTVTDLAKADSIIERLGKLSPAEDVWKTGKTKYFVVVTNDAGMQVFGSMKALRSYYPRLKEKSNHTRLQSMGLLDHHKFLSGMVVYRITGEHFKILRDRVSDNNAIIKSAKK